MQLRILFLLTLLVLSEQCKQSHKNVNAPAETVGSASTTFVGYLSQNEQGAVLRACSDGKQYRLSDATGRLDSLYQLACEPAPIPGETVYAVLAGTLSGDGSTLSVERIDTLTAKSPANACIPWEFWCSGVEPFWGLQISKAEGSLFFKDVGEQIGQAFAWVPPKTDGKSMWTYETAGLKVVIKKTPCSDGMSDLTYSYSVQLSIGDRTLNGCAIRWGEPMPAE